jgi:hypothetical protein
MKKLFSIIGFSCLSLLAFGQGNVVQRGEGNYAKLTQEGGEFDVTISQIGDGEYIDLYQKNKGNKGTVSTDIEQGPCGGNNELNIYQEQDGHGGGVLDADVKQVWDNNNATIIQAPKHHHQKDLDKDRRAYAKIFQGNDNFALLMQLSYGNEANIDQDGDRNFAVQFQEISKEYHEGIGDINKAFITQDGDNNFAVQVQKGKGLFADIEQTSGSSNNVAFQIQKSHDNTANIKQDGHGNMAFQAQDVFGFEEEIGVSSVTLEGNSFNAAKIEQVGNFNLAFQSQNGEWLNADIEQDGCFNQAYQYQFCFENTAEIKQGGNMNYAVQKQFEESHYASIVQDGDVNFASQVQTGLFGNSAVANQSGTGEVVIQNQDSRAGIGSNFASADQNGRGNVAIQNQKHVGESPSIPGINVAGVSQEGCMNYSIQTQISWNSHSSVSQIGCLNTSVVTQTGWRNNSSVSQTGAGNAAIVTQTDL